MALAFRRQKTVSTLELKSASLTLTSLALKSPDLTELARELQAQAADAPGLFDNDPLLIDLARVREATTPLDLPALIALLRKYHLLPLAACGGNVDQMAAARAAGLAEAPDEAGIRTGSSMPVDNPSEMLAAQITALEQAVHQAANAAPEAARLLPALVVDRPLRSGQQIYARGTDLVMLAMVSAGAEVIADGSIHVYAPLRGRAIAGAKGNSQARIFSSCMEAQLISIAGTYRTVDVPFPADIQGKPAQVRMDGERLVIEPIKS